MDLPKELLDGMKTLAKDFGLAKCHEALAAVSFSPEVELPSVDAGIEGNEGEPFHLPSLSPSILSHFVDSLFIQRDLKLSLENIGDNHASDFIQLMQMCNEKRLKWGDYYGTLEDKKKSGIFHRIEIDGKNNSTQTVLSQPSTVLFSGISYFADLEGDNEDQEDAHRLPHALLQSLDEVIMLNTSQPSEYHLTHCILSVEHTAKIGKWLSSNRLRSLDLGGLVFDDGQASLDHLMTGFRHAMQLGLSSALRRVSYWGLEVVGLQDHLRLVTSLQDLQLNSLIVSVPYDNGMVPQELANVRAKALDVEEFFYLQRAFSTEDMWVDTFLEGLPRNPNIRKVSFGRDLEQIIEHPTLSQTARLALNPGNIVRIERRGIYDFRKLMVQIERNTTRTEPRSTLRHLEGTPHFFDVLNGPDNTEEIVTFLRSVLLILRNQLPYTYCFGAELLPASIGAAVINETIERRAQMRDGSGDDSSRIKEPFNDLLVQLECNLVGVALLEERDTIPLGFWPMVLAKAVSGDFPSYSGSSGILPLDGIFNLVQGLYSAGPLIGQELDGAPLSSSAAKRAKIMDSF